ncbi:MAG: Rhodanese-related sulfurtransferase [Algoriphagus marincola HL-49]|uniref:Rhodanese-related sulfurtransferase n=1 Tax=Algoriphagus marincola HL-49 TaxID=1305737 RepID=A0A0N8KFI7_9BACT|nr:MAG: Rhodanese-related sulfurtransferase [Algoriphagus marincola HL-49]
MKNLSWIFLFSILLISACGTGTTKTDNQVINLDPKQFSELSPSGKIIDVRTPQEIAQGKIEGAIEMDYYRPDFKSKVLELPKDSQIFIYCAVGSRSREAAEMLVNEGFTNVHHLQGGIQAWYQQEFPLTR